MGYPVVFNTDAPTSSDTQWTLMAKLILAEGGGGGGGGGGIQQIYQWAGDPNGHVTPTTVLPCECIDTNTGQIYQKTDGLLTNTGWV